MNPRKRIVLVGAGGFGRGVYSWLRQSPMHLRRENVGDIVFVDDDDSLSETGIPWIGSTAEYCPNINDEVLCTIGDPNVRANLTRAMLDKGAQFHTFRHDGSVIGDRVSLGAGTIICPGVVISSDAQLGGHVHVNFNCSIGHDVVLGEFVTLSPAVNVMGETRLGERVFVGGSATILPRLEIGSYSVVGAGSVILGQVKESTRVVGNPGRPI